MEISQSWAVGGQGGSSSLPLRVGGGRGGGGEEVVIVIVAK